MSSLGSSQSLLAPVNTDRLQKSIAPAAVCYQRGCGGLSTFHQTEGFNSSPFGEYFNVYKMCFRCKMCLAFHISAPARLRKPEMTSHAGAILEGGTGRKKAETLWVDHTKCFYNCVGHFFCTILPYISFISMCLTYLDHALHYNSSSLGRWAWSSPALRQKRRHYSVRSAP